MTTASLSNPMVFNEPKNKMTTYVSDQSMLSSHDDTESSLFEERLKRQQHQDDAKNDLSFQVKKETRDVSHVRSLVFTLLAISCVASATATYLMVKRYDAAIFVREYTAIASSIGDLFLGALSSNVQAARAQSIAITNEAAKIANGVNMTIANFENNVRATRYLSKLDAIVWSPFLRTEEERSTFEAYAIKVAPPQADFKCDVCGDPKMVVGNPKAEVVVPGFGTHTCETIETFLQVESLAEQECAFGQLYTLDACGCIPADLDGNIGISTSLARNLEDGIFKLVNGSAVDDPGPGPYSPIWQMSPAIEGRGVLYNMYSHEGGQRALDSMLEAGIPVATEWYTKSEFGIYNLIDAALADKTGMIMTPVYDRVLGSNHVLGSIVLSFTLDLFIASEYPEGSKNIVLVYENSCGQLMTYAIQGRASVREIGRGDLHDPQYDHLVQQTEYSDFRAIVQVAALRPRNESVSDDDLCAFRIFVYPSKELESTYSTKAPWIATLVVVLVFAFTTSLFLAYDFYVAKLQQKVMENAAKTNSIVASLFPVGVRDRLLGGDVEQGTHQQPAKQQLQTFLANRAPQIEDDCPHKDAEPIADLFLNTTIMFADIEGFTAWSSEREPAQVFKLLESVYQAFDKIATRMGVFKVETIGDSYVAVCGLPEARVEHAIVMAKFARACIHKVNALTKTLEALLGPGTSDLAMRFGLHSGPVLAGVLRGEKARFQLFGDTMNTASRMESSGKVNKIHASQSTVDLFEKAGKGHWVTKRKDPVTLKGKGRMDTYWIVPTTRRQSISSSQDGEFRPVVSLSVQPEVHNAILGVSGKYDQLVEWNTNLLAQQLQKVVSRRRANNRKQRKTWGASVDVVNKGKKCFEQKTVVMDELTEVMTLPRFDNVIEHNASLLDLGHELRQQLQSYVTRIASLYRDVPFHNFEHASHVSMSASKLLKRIIAPEGVYYQKDSRTRKGAKQAAKQMERTIHDSTFGISSDPLMHLSIIFATLIHDVDHTGVANTHLVRLNTELARRFDGKCIAEQHSVVLAWGILMEDRFQDLRACIYESPEEGARFRQLVVNAVIATDIADKELQMLRKNRWNQAFHQQEKTGSIPETSEEDQSLADIDRKATIVFEHIIQASDVAHTMQHWKVFQRWNEHLFEEMYFAYVSGHSDENPVPGWYKSEIGFFDFYIIPLARKLEKCGIFGVSSDEYLNYALENRSEWEIKGEEIVRRMLEKVQNIYTPELIESLKHDDSTVL